MASVELHSPDTELQKDLQNELDSWHHLVAGLQCFQDDELDYDLYIAGERGQNYLELLTRLRDEAAKSIRTMIENRTHNDGMFVSIQEMRKINISMKKLLVEREKLRILGSNAIQEFVSSVW